MTLKLRAKVNFPASVTGQSGITVTKQNGIWTVAPDFSSLTELPSIPDPADQQIWVYTPATGIYNVVDLSTLATAVGAVPAAGDLDMNSHKITGLADGTDDGDAINKGQADTAYMAADATLEAIAGVTTGADEIIYSTDADTFSTTPLTAAARTLLDDGSVSDMRTTLGLGTAALSASGDFATAAQGLLADSATQPGDLGDLAAKDLVSVPGDLDVTGTPDGSKFLRDDGSWQSIPGGGDMLAANNLSDVASAATAFGNIKQAASDSASGVVELATSAEVATGTDTARVVTPAGAAAVYSGITRGMNPQSGTTYTLVLTDAGKFVYTTSASAVTITVPPNSDVAFPIGAQVDIAQGGTGKVTVSPGSGVTVASANNLKSISTTYAAATLIKTATDTWLLMGALTT